MRHRLSIRIQLLALALAAVVPLAGAMVYVILDASRAHLRQAEDEIHNLAAATASSISAVVIENQQLLWALARRPLVRALDPKRCDPALAEILKLHQDYSNLFVRDLRGNSVCSLLPNVVPASVAVALPWFKETVALGGFTVGDVSHGRVSGRWVSVFGYPLVDDGGTVIGMLGLPVDLLQLRYRILSAVPEGMLVGVVDRQGKFLIRSSDPEQWIGKSAMSPEGMKEERHQGSRSHFATGVDGVTRFYAVRSVAGTDWFVSVGVPKDTLYAPVWRHLAAAVAVVLGTLLFALLLVRRISAAVSGPIRNLEATTEKVAAGDLTARASIEGPVEVAKVARELNHMLEVRERAESELRHLNRTLTVLSGCNEALVRATEERELLEEMCRILVERGGHALAWIGFAEHDEAKRVRPAARFGAAGYLDTFEVSWGEGELGRGPTGTAIRTGQPVFVRDARTDESFRPWRANAERFGLRSTIALPLGRELPALGALCIYSAEPSRFNDKEVRLLVELANDVTYGIQSLRADARRRQVENEVRLQDRRFRALVENGADGIALIGENATILYMGSSITRILGYAVEEVQGRSGFDFLHPDDVEEVEKCIQKSIAHPASVVVATTRARHKDGTWRSFEVAFTNLRGEPSVEAIVANFRDITERRRAEKFLRESEERFEAAFHDSPAPLLIVSADDGRYRDVNRAWLELLRYERAQVVGHSSAEFGLWVNEARRTEMATAVLRDGAVDRYEAELRRGDGEVRLCLISSRSFEHKGVRMRLASVLDITDQRRAQKQMEEMNTTLERMVEQRTRQLKSANTDLHRALGTLRSAQDQLLHSEKMAALGRLVAGVAHELNTPIGNGLLVASALSEKTDRFVAEAAAGLRRSSLEAYVAHSREAADMLTRNLHKAASLITSFKQVAADQTSSQRRAFRLNEVVDEVLSTHRPMLRKTPIKVEARVPSGIVMDSYPGPLGQVLANLIHNAIVHAHEGRPHGSVLIIGRSLEGDAVELAVRDDGHGIAEDDLRRVFDPFFTTKLGRGGTGLGLPICHNLVTQTLGGEIRIESTPGAGTSVIIKLPLRAPDTSGVDASAPGTYAVLER